ncbi:MULTISPECIES: fluoride efflux transporter CrcB [Marinobacter]|uniref:Fluoride-specific ion channel FluC n=1 Tax=Marinobacter segnicrescens TaxID=430453 RepID=A0A1I0FNJ7_9GAMM|nr:MULTISPECIES: fluoride efflux transporter CrcB [Marinobacter]UZD65384.1 fluoride efflux transporter CrcB [Marinobacter sp. AN1]SET59818.1 CrcB protein [Marinobacter segnicrescens]
MTGWAFLAVSVGAVIGANLRWGLSLWLNGPGHGLQGGTLLANLAGAGLAGFFISWFSHSSLSPEWRLLVITGLCGALTTFSTFSLELMGALQSGKWLVVLASVAVHVLGSLAMVAVGMWLFGLWRPV